MTVENPATGDGNVICTWFDKDWRVQRAAFRRETLRKAKANIVSR
jgi:uncharacterized protein YodC (DUF2158 family)